MYDSTGFIEGVGVQKITLPFKAHEIDKVAEWLEDEDRSGMGALRPLHRLSTRLGEFKAQFDSLDLGSYDDLTSAAVSEDGEPGSDEFDKDMWSLLIVEPNRFFPLHAHPQGEVIYVVRARLYENRVLTSALVNAPTTGARRLRLSKALPRREEERRRRSQTRAFGAPVVHARRGRGAPRAVVRQAREPHRSGQCDVGCHAVQ